MKLFCPKSGISYTCSSGNGHGNIPHPTFGLPIKSLVKANLGPFADGSLNPEQIHLFGCALLAKLPVIWDTPLQSKVWIESEAWNSIIQNLATLAMRYDDRNSEKLPRFRITKETANPAAIKNYVWEMNKAITNLKEESAYESTFIKDHAEAAILRILRLSMGDSRGKNKLPALISNWAASVGNFPRTEIPINDMGLRMTLREYWKGIIHKMFSESSPIAILSDDVEVEDIMELLEHCEQNIEVGTLHSLVLFKKLRETLEVFREFRPQKVTVVDIESLTEDSSTKKEYAQGEPKASDFRSVVQYLAAKKAWLGEQK